MPYGDGTGPAGMGPMTGRAAGYCAGYPVAGYMNPTFGRGWGGGRGRRNWYYATGMPGWQRAGMGWPAFGGPVMPQAGYGVPQAPLPAGPMGRQQELEQLQGQAEYFEDVLDGLKKRIEELQTQQDKKQ